MTARLFAITWIFSSGLLAAAEPAQQCVIAGYLPSYRFEAFDFARADRLTDVILFSIEPRGDGSLNASRLPDDKLREVMQKFAATDCRVLVTIGGWGRSNAFAAVTADDALRPRLAQNLADFCERHDLDGVDVDWEHPETDAQRENYGRFLTDLKSALSPRERLVTIAVAPWERLAPASIAAVDRIHLMAYDNGGRHSTLEYAKESLAKLRDQNVPTEKICLGIPFYGRPFRGKFGDGRAYATIAAEHTLAPETDEAAGLYFNGPATVAAKVQLAREHQIRGVMIWELGQDAPPGDRSLLDAARRAADSIP